MAILISRLSVEGKNFFKRLKPWTVGILSLIFCAGIWSGITIYKNVELKNADAEFQLQANAEKKYRHFQTQPQPVITDVKTTIDLFPEKNAYKVKAVYIIENKT